MIYTTATKKAMKIAFDAHRGQTDRAGIDYVNHPLISQSKWKPNPKRVQHSSTTWSRILIGRSKCSLPKASQAML